jgi:hypothetical protein
MHGWWSESDRSISAIAAFRMGAVENCSRCLTEG